MLEVVLASADVKQPRGGRIEYLLIECVLECGCSDRLLRLSHRLRCVRFASLLCARDSSVTCVSSVVPRTAVAVAAWIRIAQRAEKR